MDGVVVFLGLAAAAVVDFLGGIALAELEFGEGRRWRDQVDDEEPLNEDSRTREIESSSRKMDGWMSGS